MGAWEADANDLVKTDVPLISSPEELVAFLHFRDVLEDGKELVVDLLHEDLPAARTLNLGPGTVQLLAPSVRMVHV